MNKVSRKESSSAGLQFQALVLQVRSLETLLAGQEQASTKLTRLKRLLDECERLVGLDLREYHRIAGGVGLPPGTNVSEDELNWEQVAREAAEPARLLVDGATSWLTKGDKKWRGERRSEHQQNSDDETFSAMHENLHESVREQILALHRQFRAFFNAVYGEALKDVLKSK